MTAIFIILLVAVSLLAVYEIFMLIKSIIKYRKKKKKQLAKEKDKQDVNTSSVDKDITKGE